MNLQPYYVLDARNNVVEARDIYEWATFFNDIGRRRVAVTDMEHPTLGKIRVSTVFLGLDHAFIPGGPPMIFETMNFSMHEDMGEDITRYATYAEASSGHAKRVAQLSALGFK